MSKPPTASAILDRIRHNGRLRDALGQLPHMTGGFSLNVQPTLKTIEAIKAFKPDHAWGANAEERTVYFTHEDDLVRFRMMI